MVDGRHSVFAVDEKITSGNITELNERFERSLDIYFNNKGKLNPEVTEYINCPNCNGKEGKSFKQKRFNYKRCKKCGMVYVTPRFKEEINNAIHSQERYVEHFKCKVIPSIDYRKNVLGKSKYEQIMQFFENSGKVLDIGCGLGELLSIFKENGWNCTGIDFNDFAVDYAAKNFGIDIIKENIFSIKMDSQFDLIMMWGILEHVYKPYSLLAKANLLLKNDGLLLIEVPSADSLLVRYCEETGEEAYRTFESARHIMLFSKQALLEMGKKSGFACRKLVSNGLDMSTLARMKNLKLSAEQIGRLQKLLDYSFQGDLLRGFFRKAR